MNLKERILIYQVQLYHRFHSLLVKTYSLILMFKEMLKNIYIVRNLVYLHIREIMESNHILGLKEHKIVDISFMKKLYGDTNALTSQKKKVPGKFNYSIVVPIRNGIFLSIATAWAFSINASLVAYGAHTGDKNYPDCRPVFSKQIESSFNQGEIDGIRSGIRKRIQIWSPYKAKLSKKQLLKKGYDVLGDKIFNTWSCYKNGKVQCGQCESCNNRKAAFAEADIEDKTIYLR